MFGLSSARATGVGDGHISTSVANYSSAPLPQREEFTLPLTEIRADNEFNNNSLRITLKSYMAPEMSLPGMSFSDLSKLSERGGLEVAIRPRGSQAFGPSSLLADTNRITTLEASVAALTVELEDLRRKAKDMPQSAVW